MSVISVGGVPAAELAAVFGTPLYAYDASVMRDRYEALLRAVPHPSTHVYYSVKAQPAVGVLRLLRALGARADACSPGDLAFAAAAGFRPDEVSYTGHAMSAAEVDAVVRAGVFFVADSLAQVEAYLKAAPGRAIGLRVNSGIAAGFHPHLRHAVEDAKFGVLPSQVPEAARRAAELGGQVVGLHAHLGSDLLDPRPHLGLLECLLALCEGLDEVRFVDIGGGWGSPYRDASGAEDGEPYDLVAFGEAASVLLREAGLTRRKEIELRLEPGGYLTLDAGVLITQVTEEKPPVQREDGSFTPHFLGVDTSYSQLMGAVVHGTHYAVSLADRPHAARTQVYDVVGHLMQAGDVLARARPLPPAGVGDVLVFEKCGAYKSCQASTFNERPRPAEVLVEDGEARLIRRAETIEDLLQREVTS